MTLRNEGHHSFDHPPSYGEAQQMEITNVEGDERTNGGENALIESISWAPRAPTGVEAHAPKLIRPVVIPRIDIGSPLDIPLPFLRAYSPVLQVHGIDMEDFMTFIDNLTIVQAAPIPLQAMSLAGDVLSFVPFDGSGLVSTGISVAAEVGSVAVAATRTSSFMKEANEEFFAPRQLKASLCKSKELIAKLGIGDDEDPTKLTLAPLDPYSLESINLRNRILKALEEHIAPLTFEVPASAVPQNVIDQLTARQIHRQIKDREKENNKKAEKIVAKFERKKAEMEKKKAKLNDISLGDSAGPSNSSESRQSNHSDNGSSVVGDQPTARQDCLRSDIENNALIKATATLQESTNSGEAIKLISDDEASSGQIDHKMDKKQQKMEEKVKKKAEKLEKESLKQIKKQNKKEQKQEEELSKRQERFHKKEQELEKEAKKKSDNLEKAIYKHLEKHSKKVEKMEFLVIESL